MEENIFKWGTSMPVLYRDWTQTTVDSITGKEKPAIISIAIAGSYSIEITNEELFKAKEAEKNESNDTGYNWINMILMRIYIGYTQKKESEKVGIKQLKSDVNDKKELLDYANERLTSEYGDLGFVFKTITIDFLSLITR